MKKFLIGLTALGLSTFLSPTNTTADEIKEYTTQPIIVTATRIAQPIDEVPISTEIITSEDFSSKSALDMGEALIGTSGLEIKSYGFGSLASPSLRGSSSSQVSVLRDGIPTNFSFLSKGNSYRL